MEDIIRQPVELIDEDLDEVAGGVGFFFFNNFDSNQGTQNAAQASFNNFDSNQGIQVGAVFL
jgi:hypothetical protein